MPNLKFVDCLIDFKYQNAKPSQKITNKYFLAHKKPIERLAFLNMIQITCK